MRRRYIVANGVLLIALGGATLSAAMLLRGQESSPVLRTIHVGTIPYGIRAPDAIGVDEQTGRAFVVDSSSGWISTLDTHTGAVLKAVDGGGGDNPLSPVVDERSGHVFIANASSSGNNMAAMLDARTGALLHLSAVSSLPTGQHMALDPQRGRLFLATGRVLDTRSGATSATFVADGERFALDNRSGHVFALMNDRLLFKGTGAGVRMLDGHGTVRWLAPVGAPHDVAVDGQTNRVFVTGSAGTTVLDARDGRPVRVDVGVGLSNGAGGAEIAVDEPLGRVLILDPGGAVTLLDARTGAVVRQPGVPAGAFTTQVAVPGNGQRAYILGDDTLTILDMGTGRVVRTTALEQHARAMAIDERRRRVVVTSLGPTTPVFGADTSTGPGTVSVLDADSGALLWTAGVGVNPVAVAVDGQTGHAFVVNMGGNVHLSDVWSWWPSWLPRPPFVPAPPPPDTVVPGSVSMLGV